MWYIIVLLALRFPFDPAAPPEVSQHSSPRSLRKLYQAVEPRTIAICIKKDDKPTDKVPDQPNRVNIKLNKRQKIRTSFALKSGWDNQELSESLSE